MSATPTRPIVITVPPALQTLAATALLLEKLERRPREASPAQYRQVAQSASELLAAAEPGPALDRLMDACPALGELWENRHYASAGLCRQPLEAAMSAELAVAAALRRLQP